MQRLWFRLASEFIYYYFYLLKNISLTRRGTTHDHAGMLKWTILFIKYYTTQQTARFYPFRWTRERIRIKNLLWENRYFILIGLYKTRQHERMKIKNKKNMQEAKKQARERVNVIISSTLPSPQQPESQAIKWRSEI